MKLREGISLCREWSYTVCCIFHDMGCVYCQGGASVVEKIQICSDKTATKLKTNITAAYLLHLVLLHFEAAY